MDEIPEGATPLSVLNEPDVSRNEGLHWLMRRCMQAVCSDGESMFVQKNSTFGENQLFRVAANYFGSCSHIATLMDSPPPELKVCCLIAVLFVRSLLFVLSVCTDSDQPRLLGS